MGKYLSIMEMDWVEEEFGVILPVGDRPGISHWEHNESGINEIEVYSCGCKFVAAYAHIKAIGRGDDRGWYSCPDCDGYKGGIAASQGFVLCPDCEAKYRQAVES